MELPKRKKARLEGYDYSLCGSYFVTICVQNKHMMLWENVGADIIRPNKPPPLSQYGIVVDEAIINIPNYYPNVVVDKYCIMPDHIHLLLFILSNENGQTEENGRIISAPTLSTIIGQMKRYASKQIGFSLWQKSFNDRIIRNEKGYQEVWQYIDENPMKWEEEQEGG